MRKCLGGIEGRPRARELAAEPPPPTLGELRRRFGKAMKDEEFRCVWVTSVEQVDATPAAQPTAPRYNPDTRPIVELIREMSRRSDTAELIAGEPNFRLELRRRA